MLLELFLLLEVVLNALVDSHESFILWTQNTNLIPVTFFPDSSWELIVLSSITLTFSILVFLFFLFYPTDVSLFVFFTVSKICFLNLILTLVLYFFCPQVFTGP